MHQDTLNSLLAAIADLQGITEANAVMIEAMVMTHPDPAALRDAWNRASCGHIALAATAVATRSRQRDEAAAHYLAAWQRKLDLRGPARD